MSTFPAEQEPECRREDCPEQVEMVLIPRTADIGGFEVGRVLPSRERRMVGPFVFWDHMGPGEFLVGQGLDVRPHPHIGLSTLTYLFQGSIDHRDSLGSAQTIAPGDVNLMTAGSGIAHSERTGPAERAHPHTLLGLQCWLALPKDREEMTPGFAHHGVADLPLLEEGGMKTRLVAGHYQGASSPVKTEFYTLFADSVLSAGSKMVIPRDTEERAIYSISGEIEINHIAYGPSQMLVLKPGVDVTLRASSDARLIILGGAVMDGPRRMWWNFVSSSMDRIEQAKRDWKEGRFAKIPGDDVEFIPLPS